MRNICSASLRSPLRPPGSPRGNAERKRKRTRHVSRNGKGRNIGQEADTRDGKQRRGYTSPLLCVIASPHARTHKRTHREIRDGKRRRKGRGGGWGGWVGGWGGGGRPSPPLCGTVPPHARKHTPDAKQMFCFPAQSFATTRQPARVCTAPENWIFSSWQS